MNVSIRHAPSFAVARCQLAGGEQMRAESGAMMATSSGVDVEAKMQGGLMKGLKRSVLGGESLFMTTFTAPGSGGWVDVAANLPGDLITLELGGPVNISRGNWLASSAGIELDTKWGGFKNLFGGEGGFFIHATGSGNVIVSCYGALDTIELAAGESVVLDSGHVVAFDPSTSFTTRKVSSGIMNTLKSGEGLVMEFTGPGRVLTQTRTPNALIAWLTTELPFSRS
ncbi:TIGR00266 family protein [Conexibacter sp. JD483]|uniref:TIGR00266 family protein n=1 Tax=unclassified Conexibacter TaxID=2627773 RepID=UPI0027242846|nr:MULTISPECIES: TIGR00266 family protein [unclassified Conexibacter]MDO8188874.1 TIGR00266 family protein [Conexibacter sp. CPCC 205706]MDO8201664.1 TIGR00266 family protein [Conexibacter sp. CPCC 205762]MDR9372910.1 TIGR00266 family protein [Conexibacter sp. JD483]